MAGFTSHIAITAAIGLPIAAVLTAAGYSGLSGPSLKIVTVSGPGTLPVWQVGRPAGSGCALSSSPSPRLARLQLSQTCRVAMPEISRAQGWQMMAGGDIVIVGPSGEPFVSVGESGPGLWEANWPPTFDLQLIAPSL